MVESESRTPLYLLTGFLGSGKTTLLKRLLAHPGLADTAVIVNEFGEVGLDHLLLEQGRENAVLLDSGCLCCALDDSLAETLDALYHRRARGEIPPFRRVVVETSGLADPAPSLHTLMTNRLLAARYDIGAVLATVEAPGLAAGLERFVELRRQIALADRLLLTKGDLVGPAASAAALALLAGLNPAAERLEVAHGAVDPAALLRPVEIARADPLPVLSHGDHHHGEHTHGIVSFHRPHAAAVPWERYADAIHAMQRTLGERLLRVKGVLRLGPAAAPHVLQGVQHVFAPPLELPPRSDLPLGLTFIGLEIAAAEIDAVVRCLEPR